MRVLRLNLKTEFFNQIRRGTKTHEFRRATPYWIKRIEGKSFDEIHICKGYPKAGEKGSTLKRKWAGYHRTRIQHDFFGPVAIEAFAINVSVKLP